MTTPLRIGLTGGIGSGKTTVADLFASRGIPVIDTDRIAHELTAQDGAAYAAVVDLFGAEIVASDGELRRDVMRRRAFEDPGLRKRLEATLHPLIREEVWRRTADVNAPYCIISIPLLVETGAADMVDRVLVVDLPEALQIDRAARRDGSDPQGIRMILEAQSDRQERLRHADDVIRNAGGPEELPPQVAQLHARYLELAQEAVATRA